MFGFIRRTFIVLLGLLLIVLFIWYAGPYFAFAEFRPLESETARLIAIGIVIGFWLLMRLAKRLRAYRASDRLLNAVVAQPQPQAEKARTPAEVVKLRERFEEAVSALKQQRRSGQSLYELPWYVIIGAPGSGKTTALINSGLRFPLEQRVGKGALRGVGGTRNCDWWFTDEAVFLDTAGRYTTQDSDAASDRVGWTEFLALLRKYRARRPLNGVIVTVSVHDLLMLDPAAREAHVEAARNRLAELNQELRIQLPVYVMVTKCDLVDGFAEYFEDLAAEGRAQVWGVTFPYEKTLANESPTLYPAEFDALMTRLNERVFERLEEVRDTRRRTKVFAFPQQMATLRDPLTQWVSDVFAAREFDGRVLLRGVYFTSGTQEGTPIDRLLGTIGRTFGTADAVTSPRGPGKAYFVEHLLKGVMIGESGLAGVNRRLELRNASLQLGTYVATGLIAAGSVAALAFSYNRNRDFLERIDRDVAAFEGTAAVTPSSPLDAIVARLDAIRDVVRETELYRDTTSLAMRWGLYEGRAIANAARDAYLRELDSILLPRFKTAMESRVAQYATDPQSLYVYFKGYLMLGEPRHLDKDYLQMLADLEWKQAGGGAAASGPAVAQHFSALLENAPTLRPLPRNGTLIGQARSSLPRSLMPKILYDGIKRANLDEPGEGLRIDQRAGLDSERVFARKSGVPLSTPMPRLFTRDQFNQITTTGRAEIVQALHKDAWIWGDNAATALASAGTLFSAVSDLYETEYIRAWDGFLDDLQLARFATIAQTNDALRILTAPTSPLRGILRVVEDNTTLVQAPTGGAPKGRVDQTTKKVTDALTGILKPMQKAAGMAAVEPGMRVTAHFQWVRQFLSGEAGKTQLDAITNSIAEIQKQIDTLGPDVAGRSPLEILSNPSFRVQMQTLRQQASALPPVVGRLVSEIADAPETNVIRGATGEVEEVYTQQVVPTCNNLIANRYPFASAHADVQLTDFATVFGYDGLFDKFFADYLEKQVDTTGPVWTWRPGSVDPSHRLLEQMQQARRIRDMFFSPGSKTPEVKFHVTFSDLDANAQRFILTIDGQNTDDKHQKQLVTWPGPVPGHATSAFESRYFDPTTAYGGPWAWFRMIDDTRTGAADAQQRIGLNIHNKYHRVRVTVEPGRATGNPFATGSWRQFSCRS
jgi:type VI secretion system protein ImpL